jgi:competence protein ComGC
LKTYSLIALVIYLVVPIVVPIVVPNVGQNEQSINANKAAPLDLAQTISESASVTQTRFQPSVHDHYGNPDRFIQYIIRIPPIHV